MADDIDQASGGDTGVSTQTGSQTSEPAQASTPVELDDNSLIRIKGSDKPISFKDVRGFQGQFTKASQEAARYKRELQAAQQREQQFQQERQRWQSQQPQGQPQDPYQAVEQMPYLSGKDAAQLLRQQAQSAQGDRQVLIAALRKIQELETGYKNLNQTHNSTAFEGKISKWLSDGGYPPEAADLAKEIYLAYEGDDLDNEFPQIFANRFDQMEKIYETRRLAKIRAAKPQPFIPGRGGQATPSKPLEVKADTNPRELADQLWNMFDNSGT